MNKKNLDNLSILGSFIKYIPNSPDEAVLEVFDNPHPGKKYKIELVTEEYTSLCPKTGQPDFGKITVSYVPDKKCIETKSFKLFLFSFRNTGMFVEDAVNRIKDKIVKAADPVTINVRGDFKSRGGIFINVESEHKQRKS